MGRSSQRNNRLISKRRDTKVLLFSILIAQLTTVIFISKLYLVTDRSSDWGIFYYSLALVCAIPQAGFSDVFGRKRHLLFSAVFILLAISYLSLMCFIEFSSKQISSFAWSLFTTLPACLLFGVAGNLIPIAYGSLSALKVHDFRTAVGASSACIGFGWAIAAILDTFIPVWAALTLTIILQALSVFVIKYYFYSQENLENPTQNRDITAVLSSYRWLFFMISVTGGLAALGAYFFSETTFYSIYSLGEDGGSKTVIDKMLGLYMSFGYAVGVYSLWKTRCSDRNGIKTGVIISLISLVLFMLYKFVLEDDFVVFKKFHLIEGCFKFFLAFGFGCFVPSLFSSMSSKTESRHAGRLFGVIDTTDTFALVSSTFIEKFKNSLKLKNAIIYALLTSLFIIACLCYRLFIKRFTTYEKS